MSAQDVFSVAGKAELQGLGGPVGRSELLRRLIPRIELTPNTAFERGVDAGSRLTLDEAIDFVLAPAE